MSRKEINELLAKTLDSPDFRRAFAQVSEERAIRPVRTCRCVVLKMPKMPKANDFRDITPGTVTAFVARDGEPLLSTLIETIEAKHSTAFNLATDQIKQMATEFSRRITRAEIHAESRPRSFPSFAEISYANKTLVGHVYIDDLLRVHTHAFPYNGGYLDRKKFSMIEYYGAGVDTPLTCVLLIRQPKLSQIEREALRLVPSESSVNNVAPMVAPPPFTPALAAFLEVATPAAEQWLYNEFVNFITMLLHGSTALASIPDAVLESQDFQNKLRSLPPEVTAAELLRLRTDLLLQQPPK